jgi:hypothetical protein
MAVSFMSRQSRLFRAAFLSVLVCVLGLSGAGCGIFGPTKNKNSDFSDTLQVGEGHIFQFQAGRSGEVTATITALSNQNAILRIWIGQLVGESCLPIFGMDAFAAVLNRTAINAPIQKGTYCLQVNDAGGLTAPVDYTVRVSHP